MAQTFTEDVFAPSHAGQTDLQNMENNFLALKTLFSGSSAPADSTGGMPWFDTGKKILKLRDSTNGSWKGVHYSGAASRWWVYNNAAEDGWIVDSSIADRILAVAGGSNAYNVAGGNAAGAWTIAGATAVASTHNHQWYGVTTANDFSYDSAGNGASITGASDGSVGILSGSDETINANFYTANNVHGHTITFGSTWRPAASVGTLQYLNL